MDRRELLKRLGGLGLLLGGGKALASEPKALEMGAYPPEPAVPVELEELEQRPPVYTTGWYSGPGMWSSLTSPPVKCGPLDLTGVSIVRGEKPRTLKKARSARRR